MRSTRLALQRWSCSSAFMLWSSVITPSTRPSYSRGTNENIFNFNHSSKPMTIERASGVLVRRWGIVWSKLEFTVRENIKVLFAVVVLHNICTLWRDHGEDVGVAHQTTLAVNPRLSERCRHASLLVQHAPPMRRQE